MNIKLYVSIMSVFYAVTYLLPLAVLWAVPSVFAFAPLIAWMKYQIEIEKFKTSYDEA